MRELTFNEIQTAAGGQSINQYPCLCIEATKGSYCTSQIGFIDAIQKCCGLGGNKAARYIVSNVNQVFTGTCTNT